MEFLVKTKDPRSHHSSKFSSNWGSYVEPIFHRNPQQPVAKCWNGLVSSWTKYIFFSFASGLQDISWIICVSVAFAYWSKNTSANTVCIVGPSLAVGSYDALKAIQSSQRGVGGWLQHCHLGNNHFKWAYKSKLKKNADLEKFHKLESFQYPVGSYTLRRLEVSEVSATEEKKCSCFLVMYHVMLKYICFCRAATSVWKNIF